MPGSLEGSPDFLIYFDHIRVDMYVKSFSTTAGVGHQSGSCTIDMIHFPEIEAAVDHLTNARVFIKNVFSDLYHLVFDGEITNRVTNWDAKSGVSVVYSARDYTRWLDKTQTPILYGANEIDKKNSAFKIAAQAISPIDMSGPNSTSSGGILLQGSIDDINKKTIREVLDAIYDLTKKANIAFSDKDSILAWVDLPGRTVLMDDIDPLLRDSQIIDVINRSIKIDTMYNLIGGMLSKLMFEMYQDIDGLIRIKQPYWYASIPKNHIIDQMLMLSFNEYVDWDSRITRTVVEGGKARMVPRNATEATAQLLTPLGVYLGGLDIAPGKDNFVSSVGVATQSKDKGDYTISGDVNSSILNEVNKVLSKTVSAQNGKYPFFLNLPGGYTITDVFGSVRSYGYHHGVDFAMSPGTLLQMQGNVGIVREVNGGSQRGQKADPTFGRYVIIELQDPTYLGYTIRYAHLDSVADNVQVGTTLVGGDTVGRSGGGYLRDKVTGEIKIDNEGTPVQDPEAGYVFGSGHLHFELKKPSGEAIDPISNFFSSRVPQITTTPLGGGGYFTDPSRLTQLTGIEKQYGVRVYFAQNELIRYLDNTTEKADLILKKFSAYLYNFINGGVITASASLIASPWLRPGFNTWIDPNGLNKIYYINTVQHSGSPTSGVFTSLGLTNGRSMRIYLNERAQNIPQQMFLSPNSSITPSAFGPVVADEKLLPDEQLESMKSAQDEFAAMYRETSSGASTQARLSSYAPTYRSIPDITATSSYTGKNLFNMWDGEYQANEIDAILATLYGDQAPQSGYLSSLAQSVINQQGPTKATNSVINRSRAIKDAVANTISSLWAYYMNGRGS